VVQNKIAAIDWVVAVYIDIGAVLIVGLGNVSGVVGKPWGNLLVAFGDERWVAVGCLAA